MLFDDPCVMLDVRGGGNRVDELRQIAQAPNPVEHLGAPQGLGDGDGIARLVLVEQSEHGIEYRLMCRPVEVVRLQLLERDICGVAVQ